MNVVQAPIAAAPQTSVPVTQAVRFIGAPGAYWRLLFRGAALLAVTLGIYRFWFATDMRRFLWSNTEIAGETLEYSGTATELLIGFLIAIAVLVPLNLVLFIAALSLGPVGQFASTLTFPLLFFLGQFAIFRARRYRLTRTIYRGVRCHQDGSAIRYAICASFWWILIVLTLGLAYPFAQSRLERFKLRHTYYGNLQGRFEGSGWRLFFRGLIMWLVVVGPLAFALAYAVVAVDWDKVSAAAAASDGSTDFLNKIGKASPRLNAVIGISIGAVCFSMLMAVVLFPVFQATVLRWWISGLRLGGLTIHSRLRTGLIYGAYLRFLWYALLFSTAASIVGVIAYYALNAALAAAGRPDLVEAASAAGGVVSYVVVMLGYSAIYQGTVKLTFWQGGMESILLEGVAALDAVKAEGGPSSAVGEGLADALNVGGI
jgi:uncharacterized membrane protein YjgN (DUF898 family)